MVDGIGGTTWEGALILYECLSVAFEDNNDNPSRSMRLLELGTGTGICGLLCASHPRVKEVVLTDRTIDLCEINVELLQADKSTAVTIADTNIYCQVIEWTESEDSDADSALRASNGTYTDAGIDVDRSSPGKELKSHFDIIFGAEITCLVKQQSKLIHTMHQLVQKGSGGGGDKTNIFFTFDDLPPPFSRTSYESKFNKEMHEKYGYKSIVVCSGCCRWTTNIESKCYGELCSDSTCIKCISVSEKMTDKIQAQCASNSNSNSSCKVSYGTSNLVYHVDRFPVNSISVPVGSVPSSSSAAAAAAAACGNGSVGANVSTVYLPLPSASAQPGVDCDSLFTDEKRQLLRALLNVNVGVADQNGESDQQQHACDDDRMARIVNDQVDCTMFHHVVWYYKD